MTVRQMPITLPRRLLGCRIFEDANHKMNLATAAVGGSMLVVSQFTLYGDVRRGKRPSFDEAALQSGRKSCTNTLSAKIAHQACAARPDVFRRTCRWNW